MKKILLFIWLAISLASARAAAPSFGDFAPTQFSVAGNKITLLNGALVTNLTVNSITFNNGTNCTTVFWPETNMLDGQILASILIGTNGGCEQRMLYGTNVLSPSIIVDTVEELVAAPIQTPGFNIYGFVRLGLRKGPFIFQPISVLPTNISRVFPTQLGTGRWERDYPGDDHRVEWSVVTGGLVTNSTLAAVLALQSAQGTGKVIYSGVYEFLHTDDVPLAENNVLFFEEGAQATGLNLSGNGLTNVAVYGPYHVAAVASPSTAAYHLTNSTVLIQSPRFLGYSGNPVVNSGSSVRIFTYDATGFVLQAGNGLTNLVVSDASGYLGTGTKALFDDGTFKVPSGGGATINSIDGFTPYRINSTTFGNSPFYRINTNAVGFGTSGTNLFLFTGLADNLFMGQFSGSLSVSGCCNAAFGFGAMEDLTSGEENTAIGYEALNGITTGFANVAIGSGAGGVDTGSSNVFIGRASGIVTEGRYNTFVGTRSGNNTGGGAGEIWNNNTFVGAFADSLSGLLALTNAAAFGYGATTTNNNQMVFGATLNTYTFPGSTLDLNGLYTANGIAGGFLATGTAFGSNVSANVWPEGLSVYDAGGTRLFLRPNSLATVTPYTFNSSRVHTGGNMLEIQNMGTNVLTVAAISGYTGTGTNFLSDDGTYKPGTGGGSGITGSGTATFLPIWTGATALGDSEIYFNGTQFIFGGNDIDTDGGDVNTGGGNVNAGDVGGANGVFTTSLMVMGGSWDSAGLDPEVAITMFGYDIDMGAGRITNSASYNGLVFTGTAGSTVAFGTGGTVAYVGSVGDFVGPSASTDNAAVLFDSTTGKLGKNSVVLIGPTGAITGVNSLTATNNIAASTINGNTITTGNYTLSGASGKTLTFNKSITLEGTDSTTMTFPATSSTIAKTSGPQTFTGTQIFGSGIVTGGTLVQSVNHVIEWSGKTSIYGGTTDGNLVLWNVGQSSFGLLQFGGTTAGFPAIARSTEYLNVVDAAGGNTSGLMINSGTPILGVLSATATLDFGSILAASSADLTITVTGAAVGDSVHLGLPAAPDTSVTFNGFVSAANTVTVRGFNIGAIAADPASATYRATVMKF